MVKKGDDVLAHGVKGTVKFLGGVEFSPGVWVGVELEKPRGRNDGSVDGVEYFSTKPNYGVFIPEKSPSLQTYNRQEEAAIKVQSMVRKNQSIKKSKTNDLENTLETFKAWASIDELGERDALNHNSLNTQVQQILKDGAEESSKAAPGNQKKHLRAMKSSAMLELPAGNEDYTLNFCKSLVKKAKKLKPGESLVRADMVQQILYHFTLLQDDTSECMVKLQTPANGRMIIVGDTHGQLEDLMWIFFKHGFPSPTNVYVFNGDITDRGLRAVEAWIILLSFKLMDVNIIHFNRGNHEDDGMNSTYGFLDELTAKYGDRGFDLYRNFQYVFCTLPLFTVVDDDILFVHAGLPRQAKYLRLSQLAAIDHRRPIPDRPRPGDDTLFFDAMWSDPSPKPGTEPNNRGPDVVSFGPDITKEFLKQNNLRFVVRSHQVPTTLRGFQWHHDNQLLTIFSASNYCGVSGNQGAVAIIKRGLKSHEDFNIVEHWAPDWTTAMEHLLELEKDTEMATHVVRMEAVNIIEEREKVNLKDRAGHLEEEITAQAKPLFVQRKKELYHFWESLDTNREYHVTIAQWREGCAAICDEHLPWKKLQYSLGLIDKSHPNPKSVKVQYVQFLSRFRIGFSPAPNMPEVVLGWEERLVEDLYLALLRADLSVDATFAAIDRNRDGTVDWRELKKLLENTISASVTTQQAQMILQKFGGEGKTDMSLLHFIQSIQLTFRRTHAPLISEKDHWVPKAMEKLTHAILRDAQRRFKLEKNPRSPAKKSNSTSSINNQSASDQTLLIIRWFEYADANGNGYLSQQEFCDAVMSLDRKELEKIFESAGGPSQHALNQILKVVDYNNNENVNFLEFIKLFDYDQSEKSVAFRESLLDEVCGSVFFQTLPIKQAVRFFNPSGMITPDEFERALAAVSTAYAPQVGGQLFTPKQAEILATTPHLDESGKINALAFLASFRLIDTHRG